MTKNEIIATLNDLIEVCNDGKEGFNACANHIKIESLKLKTLLAERSRHFGRAAETLVALVHDEGGVAAINATVGGELHRGWFDLKEVISGKTDGAVLEECERRGIVAKSAYLKALAKDLPPHIRIIVEQQFQGVLNNYYQIKHHETKPKH
jgi:uncharacterized protein (TIGR02284 family)